MNIICFGDSNTYGYDPRSRFGESYDSGSWVDILRQKTNWNIHNEGVNGREIPDEPEFFPAETDLLIIMLGTNDLLQFWTPENATEKMRSFLQTLTISKEKILLIAPPAMQFGDWVLDQELISDSIHLAEEYRTLSSEMGIRFLDAGEWGIPLAYDGVHFTAEGHRLFAEQLYGELIR